MTIEPDNTSIPTLPAEGPLRPREAARAVSDARRKGEGEPVAAAAADPHIESADEAGVAPPGTAAPEAPGETGALEPAERPPIEPPRSWTKDAKERWHALPRETQEYLASREQERDRELRRSQNETAERLKGLSAKELELEQARRQYDAALPALLQTLQQAQAGEFADIRTLADVERLAAEDWPRYVRWDASQKKIAAVAQELRATQERQAVEAQERFAAFARREDELFAEKAPEFAEPAEAARLQEAAVDALRELGFADAELARLWNGQATLSLRDHRVQLLVRDGLKYREAQAAARKAATRLLPPVQRPGVAPQRGAARAAELQSLSEHLDAARGMDALRTAAKLVATRRANLR